MVLGVWLLIAKNIELFNVRKYVTDFGSFLKLGSHQKWRVSLIQSTVFCGLCHTSCVDDVGTIEQAQVRSRSCKFARYAL